MKVIIKDFYENKLNFYIQHEKSEFRDSQIINQILKNYESFEKLMATELNFIENTNDYITYLIFKQIFAIKDSDMGSLSEEDAKRLENLCFLAEDNNKIDKGNVIKFIQTHYEEIFRLPIGYIENITIDIIAEYASGFGAEIREYLFQNYTHFIIHQFNQFEKWFIDSPNDIKKVIKVAFLEQNYWAHLSKSLDILRSLRLKKSKSIKEVTDGVIKEIYNRLVVIAKNQNEVNYDTRDILILDSAFTDFADFLVSIQSPLANEFKSTVNEINSFVNNYIAEHGQPFSYKIPYPGILEKFKSPESDVIELTHQIAELDNEKRVSRLGSISPKSKGLFDLFSSDDKTNDYFTRSHQRQLNIFLQASSMFVYEIINDSEALNKFQCMLYPRIAFISKCLNSKEDLKEAGLLLLNSISFLASYSEEDPLLLRTQCYNTSILTFVVIEKLLRSLCIELVKNERYVPKSVTLSPVLTSEELRKFFGETYLNNLTFFLSKTGKDKEIGHDYRNRFAHYSNISNKMLTIQFTAQILYLFLDVLNTLFLYCVELNYKLEHANS